MNGGSWVLLVLAALAAVADWIAVQRQQKKLEYVCKPLTIAALIGLAATIDVDNDAVRLWFVLALALSLVGDVCLMLERDLFVPGLAAFLFAHLAFVAGLWVDGIRVLGVVVGLGIGGIAVLLIGGKIIDAVRRGESPGLAVPVGAYMAAISAMVASAIGTQEPLAIAGASLFYCSDALIAWERFVKPRSWHRLAIIVTYHLAQGGLTLSLLT